MNDKPREPMKCLDLFIVLVLTMFSSTTRAFVSRAQRDLSTPLARGAMKGYMSASSSDPPTSIVSLCEEKIQKALDAESVKVTGAFDDPNGSHISIQVVSSQFEGKRPMQRQQLVYKAIWEELQGPVHAVDSMICKTPSEE